jgi:steroid 5-alpha reductase family enzyme
VRVVRDGSDGRFDSIKPSWPRLIMTWTLQGLWVLLTLSCALAAMTSATSRPLGLFAVVGSLVWVLGFAIEAAADQQKTRFRADPANHGRFIESGIWAWSRHPNYFGEITLWVGVALIALPALTGWQYATLISPVFVYVLLTRISGIPLLESRGKKKWGAEPEYVAYRERTPVLFPRPPR